MEEAVREKRACFKTYKNFKKLGKTAEAKKARTAYNETKRVAKHVIWLAKSEAEKAEFASIPPDGSSVYRIAKQMDRTNQDVVGEKCVRSDAGELSLSDEEKMKAWVELYARLLNVEFEWPCDLLPEVPPVAGPPSNVSAVLIRKALRK